MTISSLRLIGAMLLTTWLLGCTVSNDPSAAIRGGSGITSDEQAVREAQENLFEILLNKQAYKLNGHYLPEVTRFHQEGELDVGWSQARSEEFQRMFDNGLSLVLRDWEIVDTRVYGNSAITAGYANVGWQDAEENGDIVKIRFTYIWIKTADGWREAHHHASDFKGRLRF